MFASHQPVVKFFSFTIHMFNLTVDHGITRDNDIIFHAEISNTTSAENVRYWVEDMLSGLSHISPDEITGDARMVITTPLASFIVIVHAGSSFDSKIATAQTIIGIHLTFHFQSSLRNVALGLVKTYPGCSGKLSPLVGFRFNSITSLA